jgi:hypothetical protein
MPKGNPNPSPATRFGAEGTGNPSRAKKKGSRDRLSKDFLAALSDDFAVKGKAVIATVRRKDPSTYLRVVAGLQRQEIEVITPEAALSDDELELIYQTTLDRLRGKGSALAEMADATLAPGSQRVN